MKCAAGWNTVCLLPFQGIQSAGNPVEMKEGWDGAVRRRGFPPLICALYLQPAEPGEIIFQSSSDQASSLIHSFFSCVFISLPLLLVSHVVLCCTFHFSLFTCSLLTGIKFHWKSRGTHLRHTMNTRYYSAAAHKLSLPYKRDHKPQL